MTPEQKELASKALREDFLAAGNDVAETDRFFELYSVLQNNPEEFWDAYFASRQNDPDRITAEDFLAVHGDDASFADMQKFITDQSTQ